MTRIVLALALSLAASTAAAEKRLLWGDTHLHTSNSFDAYLNRNLSADPDTAFRYAKGLPVVHPFHRARVQIQTPLDFMVLSDHAELLGVIRTVNETGIPREGLGVAGGFRAWLVERWLRGVIADDEGAAAFASFLPDTNDVEAAAAAGRSSPIPNSEAISETVWREAIATADAHDEPGRFTALIGWEWSSIPAGANLHRVVVTSAGADVAGQFLPLSSAESMYPEDLWKWLDETSARTGADFVSIPHNSNISKGYMFPGEKRLRGTPIDAAWAEQRAKWETTVEATQFKGDSETHPIVSPDDPFAGFEIYPHYIQQNAPPYDPKPGDFVRSALRTGLDLEARLGVNPYRFGLIGSTDAHTGLSSAEEPNFWGKMARDSIPENKAAFRVGRQGVSGWSMSASGLAAVWAEENTREAILAAFKRRETYATTGPRIQVRVFAGTDFAPGDENAPDLAAIGHARGVPMGGELGASSEPPRFVIQAAKDPKSGHLDRVQMVKGWLADGTTHEKVYDVAWAGDRAPGADGFVPPVPDTVDPATATYTDEHGAPTLAALWTDPDFDPKAPAFYYVRVLEVPTPRHSTFDALALGIDPAETGHPVSIQERAYTSPIWYRP
ncbi:MAG: DUF3604 domain-containing protein [Myxococcota bacterium]